MREILDAFSDLTFNISPNFFLHFNHVVDPSCSAEELEAVLQEDCLRNGKYFLGVKDLDSWQKDLKDKRFPDFQRKALP